MCTAARSPQLTISSMNFIPSSSYFLIPFRAPSSPFFPGQALFRLFPSFCLADGLSSLALREQGLDPDLPTSAFAWDVSGANIVYLALKALLYFCVALLLDYLPPLSHMWHAFPSAPRPWSRRAPLAPAYSLAPSTPTAGAGPGVLPPSPRLVLTGEGPGGFVGLGSCVVSWARVQPVNFDMDNLF
jgi:hypothetical protein